jgi:hypothetical protein
MLRHQPPTLRRRFSEAWLNVLAATWAVRLVWCLRKGRLPASRKAKANAKGRRSLSRA